MDGHELKSSLNIPAYLHLVSTINNHLEFDIKGNTGLFFKNQMVFPRV